MSEDIIFPKEIPPALANPKEPVDEEIRLLMSAAQFLAVKLDNDPLARDRLRGYVHFLLEEPRGRQYHRLAEFLDWYGTKYLLPSIHLLLSVQSLLPSIAVEFGPGNGWLLYGLADLFKERYAVDKRGLLDFKYISIGIKFYRIDLEKDSKNLVLPQDSIILANHFLHCVDNWGELIGQYKNLPWLVIEPEADSDEFPYWYDQMELFGAKPLDYDQIELAFEHWGLSKVDETKVPGQRITLWRPA